MKKITYQMMRLLIAASFMACCSAQAELRLPVCFSDNMVLQRSPQRSAVYGTATPGAKVALAFAGRSGFAFSKTVDVSSSPAAEQHGTWKVLLPARPAVPPSSWPWQSEIALPQPAAASPLLCERHKARFTVAGN